MEITIGNAAGAQTFHSDAGVSPPWVAQVGDAVMLTVSITGDHVKQEAGTVNLGQTVHANCDKGSGLVKLEFTVGGLFQTYQTCSGVTVPRGSSSMLIYEVRDPTWPSVHYVLRTPGADVDLGEAVLGQHLNS